MAKYYKTTGEVLEVKPENGKHFVYKELQAFIKGDGEDRGMVEIVPLPDGKSIVVNEEGKEDIGVCRADTSKNIKATEVWKKVYPIDEYPDNNDELICGNALVCEESELE